MNGTFENMIRRYSEELLKMSREKALPDPPEEIIQTPFTESAAEEGSEKEESEAEDEKADTEEKRQDISDIPGIEAADFYRKDTEDFPPFSLEEPENFAYFTARISAGTNAFPVENAKVLVIKDNKLFVFLTTDSDGLTQRVRLPSYPEANSFEPESDEQYVEYKAEVYAEGFSPKKDLLVSAVGGSDIVLDVQMTPLDERVN